MLVELTTAPNSALPVPEFRQHLRMGTGFGEDNLQDAILENLLKAALAAIEGRTGKALLSRRFVYSLTAWRDSDAAMLPVAPVSAIHMLRLIGRTGDETIVAPSAYRLVQDMHRPKLQATSMMLPTIMTGGSAEIEFQAGYGAAWPDIPSDLGHAALLLAAHYYEHRHDATSEGIGQIPFGVGALIERYRSFRITAAGARR
jgi:uncharacterized phiE125 gp8 family phage protein